jgi:hypothetical protein
VSSWINLDGRLCRSELHFLARRIDEHLARWPMCRFRRLWGA